MAIEFAESWEGYKLGNSTGDAEVFTELDSKWTSHFLTLEVVSTGRTGKGLTIQGGSNIFKTLAHRNFWSTVFAFRINAGTGGSGLYAIMHNGVQLFAINYDFDHTLSIFAGSNLIAVTDVAVHQ